MDVLNNKSNNVMNGLNKSVYYCIIIIIYINIKTVVWKEDAVVFL